jgi:hypothetical protein
MPTINITVAARLQETGNSTPESQAAIAAWAHQASMQQMYLRMEAAERADRRAEQRR